MNAELYKEETPLEKRNRIEAEILGNLSYDFYLLLDKGTKLWQYLPPCIFEKVRNFYEIAVGVEKDKKETNEKIKKAVIVKLWIEGIFRYLDEETEDESLLKLIIEDEGIQFTIKRISLTSYDEFVSMTETIGSYLKGNKDAPFWCYIEDKLQEFCGLYEEYEEKGFGIVYDIKKAKIIIETLCSSIVFFEEKDFG